MKRQKLLAVSLTAILLGGCGYWLFGDTMIERWRFYRFDTPTWLSTRAEQRYYMARFLLDSGVLTGKSRAEVLSMLGKPDSGSVDPSSTDWMLYCLGPERGSMFRIDDDWLEITFSHERTEKGVIAARIRPD